MTRAVCARLERAFVLGQEDTRRALGLCNVPTARGNVCDHALFEDFPACWNHLPRWIAASFANRRAFVTPRVMRVGRVWLAPAWQAPAGKRESRRVVVDINKRRGEAFEPGGQPWHVEGFTSMWLDPDEATVLADLLESLGNTPAAELILAEVGVLANAQTSAHPMT